MVFLEYLNSYEIYLLSLEDPKNPEITAVIGLNGAVNNKILESLK